MPIHPSLDLSEIPGLSDEDRIGVETLRRMASVSHYNQWIYEELAPWTGDRVLEVGCGIGNMTAYFLDRELLVSIDRLSASVAYTRELFAGHENFHVLQGDIVDPDIFARLQSWQFDTVISINVLEHIREDAQALAAMWDLVQPGGRVLLVVPAGRYLYGTLDRALGHYRRYDRAMLRQLAEEVGFGWEELRFMNLAGIPGWWLNSRVLHRTILPAGQLQWFNWLAPLFIHGERWLRRVWDVPAGQSLIAISQKKT